MNTDPVAAITEAAASGETAEIFADLRATLGVNVVNLIWRHIATMPGALAWAWATVRPIYASGRVAAEAERIRAGLAMPDLPAWPRAVLACAGVDPMGEASIRRILASYKRSNALNLAALSALVRRIDGGASAPPPGANMPASGAPAPDAPIEGALPRLLALDDVGADTADLILRTNLLGDHAAGRITASMYRHLAHWPGYLSLCHAHLAPLAADGRLDRLIGETLALADAAGARLQSGMADIPAPASAVAVRAAADDFIHNAIGKMVPVAGLLIAVMPV